MSLRSRLSLAISASLPERGSGAVCLVLILGACSPGAAASSNPTDTARGLTASSSGVCAAIDALPDVSAARRAFTNLAHDALHGLAADPRLGRATSAHVLEAMERVEVDFGRSPDVAVLASDLAELRSSADTALQALGEEVPACPD